MKKFILVIIFALPFVVGAAAEPEMPRLNVDTSMPALTGKAIEVKRGGDLQAAINSATYGDEVILESGAEFKGSFVLKKKTGTGWIIIRSADKARMAKIISPGRNLPAISTEPGASGYRIMDMEVAQAPGESLTNLVLLGNATERSLEELPKKIVLDNVYVHGDENTNLRRCIALNGANIAVINSKVLECHDAGADSQAIAGWNGPGPFLIENNHLEGAGENILFGGGDPLIAELVPSDIVIRNNRIVKPLEWKNKNWLVKNLFETKNARRVLVENNIFENSWVDGQTGTAILIKSANQGGKCTWCVSEDILFRNNVVRNATEGLRINAAEGTPLPKKVSRIKFENMKFEDISGKLFQIFNGSSDITFDRVTGFAGNAILMGDGGQNIPNPGLVIRNSVLERGKYGIGAGSEEGKIYLNKWFPGAIFESNTIINTSGTISNDKLLLIYPAGTKVVSNIPEQPAPAPTLSPTPIINVPVSAPTQPVANNPANPSRQIFESVAEKSGPNGSSKPASAATNPVQIQNVSQIAYSPAVTSAVSSITISAPVSQDDTKIKPEPVAEAQIEERIATLSERPSSTPRILDGVKNFFSLFASVISSFFTLDYL